MPVCMSLVLILSEVHGRHRIFVNVVLLFVLDLLLRQHGICCCVIVVVRLGEV